MSWQCWVARFDFAADKKQQWDVKGHCQQPDDIGHSPDDEEHHSPEQWNNQQGKTPFAKTALCPLWENHKFRFGSDLPCPHSGAWRHQQSPMTSTQSSFKPKPYSAPHHSRHSQSLKRCAPRSHCSYFNRISKIRGHNFPLTIIRLACVS